MDTIIQTSLDLVQMEFFSDFAWLTYSITIKYPHKYIAWKVFYPDRFCQAQSLALEVHIPVLHLRASAAKLSLGRALRNTILALVVYKRDLQQKNVHIVNHKIFQIVKTWTSRCWMVHCIQGREHGPCFICYHDNYCHSYTMPSVHYQGGWYTYIDKGDNKYWDFLLTVLFVTMTTNCHGYAMPSTH